LVYKQAPVLVSDITVEDPKTRQQVTLDGVLGMNYFVASAHVEESMLMPDIKNLAAGPYDAVVIDEPHATLGVKLKAIFDAHPPAAGAGAEPGTIEIKPSTRPRKR